MKSIITLFLLFVYIVVFAQRLSQPLNNHWKFIRKDIGTIANTDNWESVTLPHCWNIVDGQQSGKNRLDENPSSCSASYYRRIDGTGCIFLRLSLLNLDGNDTRDLSHDCWRYGGAQ